MYAVEFYDKPRGESDLWLFIEELQLKSATDKSARIQFKQIAFYIELLQDKGTCLPENVTIEYFISFVEIILLYYSINLEKNRRRHLAEKSTKQNRSVKIILRERI